MTKKGQKDITVKLPIITERFMMTLLRLLSSPSNFTKKSLNNIEYLFEVLDINFYKKDITTYSLIQAVMIAVNYRQRTQNFSQETLLTEIDASITEQFKDQKENIIIPTIINSKIANDNEVLVVNDTIESYLKYSTILLSKEKVFDALTNISSGDIVNLQNAVNEYRDLINSIGEEFRRTDNMSTGNIVHSMEDDYFNILMESYESLRNPKHTLITGLKMFNEMLSEHGGFLLPSYVIIYASINSFKSALLQYCVKWIRKYNSDKYLKTFQDTGKIPTILFYSFENTRKENAQREFTMETGRNLKDIDDPNEVKLLWDNHYHATNSIINVATVYAESGTVRVSDMRRQIHGLNDSGFKVIAVVVDYLELIRPEDEDSRLDNRLKLGYISNALHVMSITEEILVLTAQQMNRSAEATMSDLREKNSTNIVKSLNRQYIGESYAIDKPVDLSMYLALERSIFDNKLYMTLKRDKCRYRRTELDYFVHELKNGFYIEDDVLLDRILSKKSIAPETNAELKLVPGTNEPNRNKIAPNESLREKKLRDEKEKKNLGDVSDDIIESLLNMKLVDYVDEYYYNLNSLFSSENDTIWYTPYNLQLIEE